MSVLVVVKFDVDSTVDPAVAPLLSTCLTVPLIDVPAHPSN